jgi:flagellar biosynthesis/type III secretory pathway protein FliH
MNLSLDELERIKKKSFQEGYDEGHKIGFEKGYEQAMHAFDSCLEARIDELGKYQKGGTE